MKHQTQCCHIVYMIMVIVFFVSSADILFAQTETQPIADPPPRSEGEGPFDTLILYGATVINGTGTLPYGPVSITIKNNRIDRIRMVGTPGMPLKPAPEAEEGQKIIDCSRMYIMPGFIHTGFNVHSKVRTESKEDAEQVGKYMITKS